MTVLIPAYEPDDRLVDLVAALPDRIVVVDDGSGPRYAHLFQRLRSMGATVLTHPVNLGKGAALRTGYAHLRASHPDEPVVCADSDGQHTAADIAAVAAALSGTGADMVLGARSLRGSVPLRSRFGNSVTGLAFRAATGTRLTDTQTGLRGYPARMLDWLGEVPGDRFEYELRLLLLGVRQQLRIVEVPISTIYLDGNASSHFRPVRDSARIYAPLLTFAASSVAGFLVDLILLLTLYPLLGNLFWAALTARVGSAAVNFAINRRWVFHGRGGSLLRAAGRYALLACGVFATNVALLWLLDSALGNLLLAKMLTEATVFGASFLLQRTFVFRSRPVPAPPSTPARSRGLSNSRH